MPKTKVALPNAKPIATSTAMHRFSPLILTPTPKCHAMAFRDWTMILLSLVMLTAGARTATAGSARRLPPDSVSQPVLHLPRHFPLNVIGGDGLPIGDVSLDEIGAFQDYYKLRKWRCEEGRAERITFVLTCTAGTKPRFINHTYFGYVWQFARPPYNAQSVSLYAAVIEGRLISGTQFEAHFADILEHATLPASIKQFNERYR